jgi:hypothetical protein
MQLTTWTPGSGLRRTILPLTLIGAVTFAETVGSGPAALEAYWLAIQEGAGGSVRRQNDLGFRFRLLPKRKRNPRSYFLSGTNRIPAASRASDAVLLASSCSACCTRNGVSPGEGCFRS